MTPIRRQPRTGNYQRIQVRIDQLLHAVVAELARQQGVTLSRAASQLMERGAAQTINPTATDSHGH